jgi:hypothetical protein
LSQPQPDPRYQSFWRYFRAGRFHEAQSSLEALCRECDGRDQALYQGLSRVAESLQQLNEGKMETADIMAREAGAGLAGLGPSYGGVQLQSLLLGLSACVEDARRSLDAQGHMCGLRVRIPRVDLAFGLDPDSTTD